GVQGDRKETDGFTEDSIRDHSEIRMTGVYTGNEFTHKKGLDHRRSARASLIKDPTAFDLGGQALS
ncbi:MAG: hypothetical protein ACOYJU_06700, partial [Anaerovoracaceae bacterium]